jgi:hypothetical protein
MALYDTAGQEGIGIRTAFSVTKFSELPLVSQEQFDKYNMAIFAHPPKW